MSSTKSGRSRPSDAASTATPGGTDPFPNTLIRASAGTGKTYQLSNRFLSLLSRGVPLDEILAVTFTRKAAGEILDRVLLRLAEAAADEGVCRKLAEALQTPDFSQPRARELLQHVIRNTHRLRIGTLDSFFGQLAGSFSLELGLPVQWRIMEALDEARLRDESIESILQDHAIRDTARLMHLLTKGEPKRSVVELIRDTVTRLHGILLDSTDDAWDCVPKPRPLSGRELLEAIERFQNAPMKGKSAADSIRDSAAFALRGEWNDFLSKGIPNSIVLDKRTYYRVPIPDELWQAGETLIAHARAIVLSELATQTSATRELLLRFDETFQRQRHLARAMRFDDVTRCLADVVEKGGLGRNTFRLDAVMHHVLLDEFQDTSPAQWKVLRPFVRRAVGMADDAPRLQPRSSEPRHDRAGSFFCVGDIKQAIYGWRGGSSEIFDVVASETPGLQSAELARSFRSSQPVIDLVNRVFQNLTSHDNLEKYETAFRLWQERFPLHTTAKPELPGYACLLTAPESDADESQQKTAERMQFTARKVAEISRQAPGKSVAVLARKNEHVARVIFELGKLGIRASEEGGNPLSDSAAVQAILSLLRLADHPGDQAARYHVARSPLGKVVGLETFANDAAAAVVARTFRRALAVRGYGPAIESVVEPLLPLAGRRDRARLLQLIEMAYEHQRHATLRADDFVRLVETERVPDPSAADVRVTTIHKSKGLQFDVVVLPDWEGSWAGETPTVVVGRPHPTAPIDRVCRYRNKDVQSLLPPALQELFENHLERTAQETLCVMYVALTRAIHAVYAIVAPDEEPRTSRPSKLPKTMAGVLRAALTNGEPLAAQTIAFEVGDPKWTAKLPLPSDVVASSADSPPPRAAGRIAFAAPCASERSLGRTSPSQLEGGAKQSVAQMLRLDNAQAMARGTVVHAWFEQMEWLEDGVPDSTALRQTATTLATSGLNLGRLETDFRKMLRHPPIAQVLSRSYYDPQRHDEWKSLLGNRSLSDLRLEVRREQRILSRLDDGLLDNGLLDNGLLGGSIDRLVMIYSGDQLLACDVIDFKTDVLDTHDELGFESRVHFYRPQMEAYRRAVAEMLRCDLSRITSRLVFVSAGVIRGHEFRQTLLF